MYQNNVKILLDHVHEGLLLFSHDFKIQDGYSKECLDIFNTDTLVDKDIREVLFQNNDKDRDLFNMAINNSINASSQEERNLYLSFPPTSIAIDNQTITLEYKSINNLFMIIASDITGTLLLEKEVEYQSKIQDMIVAVASNLDEFLDLKSDFIKFLESIEFTTENNCNEVAFVTRTLHTYKGVFSQKNMVHITQAIHTMELAIKEHGYNEINSLTLQTEFTKDIKLLSKVIGEDYEDAVDDFESMFFDFGDEPEVFYNVNEKRIDSIASMISDHIDNNTKDETQNILKHILTEVKSLKSLNVYELLKEIPLQAKSTAFKLKKDINPIGTIKCEYQIFNNNFILEISDDGAGINIARLEEKILEKELCTTDKLSALPMEEKYNFIFCDYLSVKDDTSEVSGMGIGMATVKFELDKIGGTIQVDSKKDLGVHFVITIPLTNNPIGD